MLAFHNDPTIKQATLDQIAMHRKLDQIIQGQYWDVAELGAKR